MAIRLLFLAFLQHIGQLRVNLLNSKSELAIPIVSDNEQAFLDHVKKVVEELGASPVAV